MTTNAMAPPPCSPHSISSRARSSAAACSATGTRNSSAFSMPSSAKWRPTRRPMSSSTTMATHKHPKVRGWLARHPRVTFHFTPTSCSWANAVEGWFAKLTRQRLKRGVFLDRRTADRHQPLHRRGQRQTQAVRLDQIRRRDPRRRPTRETSVRSDPLGAPSLCSYNPLFLKVPHHRSFRRGAEYHCEERKHKSEKRQKPYCFASGEINIV